jgi:hypothetical protein
MAICDCCRTDPPAPVVVVVVLLLLLLQLLAALVCHAGTPVFHGAARQ